MKKLAIIGRPNVGKSALFNSIIKKDKSIVHHHSGVTRDVVVSKAVMHGHKFLISDVAGYEENAVGEIEAGMQELMISQMKDADGVIFAVDGRNGLMPEDFLIAKMIRAINKPVIVSVNKCDTVEMGKLKNPFFELGFLKVRDVSAFLSRNVSDMVLDLLQEIEQDQEKEELGSAPIKIAMVGKPNVGKSSLFNKMIDRRRSIVSSIPGTTRDSVDIEVVLSGRKYIFVDTAGLRKVKSKKIESFLETLGMEKAKQTIENVDVVILVVDSLEGLCSLDKKIFNIVKKSKKPMILAMNKWDKVKIKDLNKSEKYLDDNFKFMKQFPKHFVSAKTGKNVKGILSSVHGMLNAAKNKVPTAILNAFIKETVAKRQPEVINTKRLNIYYAVQVSSLPPEFVIFVNNSKLLSSGYLKYLQGRIIEKFGFTGMPISVKARGRNRGY